MKKNNLKNKTKYILVLIVIFITFAESFSQPLFADNFNYSVRDTLAGIGNWFCKGNENNY